MALANFGIVDEDVLLSDNTVARQFAKDSDPEFVVELVVYHQVTSLPVSPALTFLAQRNMVDTGSAGTLDNTAARQFAKDSDPEFVVELVAYQQVVMLDPGVTVMGGGVGFLAMDTGVIDVVPDVAGDTVAGIFVPVQTNIPHTILVGPMGPGVRRRIERDFSAR